MVDFSTYGITMNQIVTANELENPNKLVSGMALVIPTLLGTHMSSLVKTYGKLLNVMVQPFKNIVRTNQLQNPNRILAWYTFNHSCQ